MLEAHSRCSLKASTRAYWTLRASWEQSPGWSGVEPRRNRQPWTWFTEPQSPSSRAPHIKWASRGEALCWWPSGPIMAANSGASSTAKWTGRKAGSPMGRDSPLSSLLDPTPSTPSGRRPSPGSRPCTSVEKALKLAVAAIFTSATTAMRTVKVGLT